MATSIPAKQIMIIADFNLINFNARLNSALLVISQEVGSLDDIQDVKLATSIQTTYPTDSNVPISKPYYTGMIIYTTTITIIDT